MEYELKNILWQYKVQLQIAKQDLDLSIICLIMSLTTKITSAVLILFIVFIQNVSSQQLYENPSHLYDSGRKQSTSLKISPDNQYFIVGYKLGELRVYKTSVGSIAYTIKVHIQDIVEIVWEDGQGPITIDASGLIIKWNSQFEVQTRWNVPALFTTCSSVKTGGTTFVSFNYGITIQEYSFVGTTMTKVGTYTITIGSQFNFSVYDPSHTYLFASSMNRQTQVYYTINQTEKLTFNTNFALMSMGSVKNYPSIYIIGTDQNNVYRINEEGVQASNSNYGQIVKDCKNQDSFILASTWGWYFQTINKQTYQIVQDLGYQRQAVQQIECSDEHLIIVDQDGWISINQFSQSKTLTIIILLAVFIIIMVGIYIIDKKIIKRDKKSTTEVKDQYENIKQKPINSQ